MATMISRQGPEPVSVSVTASTSTSGKFTLGERAGALLHVVSASATGLTLKFYSLPNSKDLTERYLLRNEADADISITISANYCYQLPDELFSCKWIQPILSSGTATIKVLSKT